MRNSGRGVQHVRNLAGYVFGTSVHHAALRAQLLCRKSFRGCGGGTHRTGRKNRSHSSRQRPVSFVEIGQRPAVAVVHTLRRVGGERDTLPERFLRELRRLRTPTADRIAGLVGSGVSIPSSLMRRRPWTSSRMSTVSPSTTFSTTAVVATGSERTVSSNANKNAPIVAARPAAERLRSALFNSMCAPPQRDCRPEGFGLPITRMVIVVAVLFRAVVRTG